VAARETIARNPQLKWANLHQRGYATLQLTPQRATAEWVFMQTIREHTNALGGRHVMSSLRGSNRYS